MKRSRFLLALISSVPFAALANYKQKQTREDKGFKVGAGEGRTHGHIQLKGVNANILDLKVSGKDTNGELAIFEQTGLSPNRGTPLHVHHNQDEIFNVIEGEYHFIVGTDKFKLTAGDTIFLPRKVPHAWTQVSQRAKMNVIVQPAGKLEEFFVTMAAFKGEPTKEQIARIFSDNEMQIVGPPLTID
ncbi:MAG TPA: cupin domain-containing protein [Flavisolibacter sp.]|nr:cupin domain-containing protein [Flavisolibacter sp.]